MATQSNCCLAKTMILEESHEIGKLAVNKNKAAFCFVTPKGQFVTV